MIAGLETDRHERQVAAVVERALAHERGGDRQVKAVGEVSQGQWQHVHWEFISGRDLGFDLIWVMAEVTMIMLVGMYFGYRAKGGPVGVGAATAKSMMFNIIAIHVLGAFLVVVLWGLYPKVPIGG